MRENVCVRQCNLDCKTMWARAGVRESACARVREVV